ncbi:trimeric intracellular cation channel family protein [Suttonella ornithocola]|uniref:Predicted membrane protein n=1 Tax=Suttonella ornithocola TaxID=279832 RepID=A0A380MPZ9_9GAMM|nr:trimeric intracellular cation channel family protein [Suttonella ornithocola]SUO94358.1 Predicted membrane protein [Suttonella ornithocola]
MESTQFIYILDLIGCAASAAAAAMLAKRVGLDFLGAVMIAAIGAIGGGTCRDLLINRHPLFWLKDLNYLTLTSTIAILVQIFYYTVDKYLDRPIRLFDAIGLSAFSIIGFQAALTKGLPYPMVILMGIVTAVNGGILRDIICGQIPLVLRKEIYISCVIIGGIVYLTLLQLGVGEWIRNSIVMATIFLLRMLAIYRRWNLPDISLPKKE